VAAQGVGVVFAEWVLVWGEGFDRGDGVRGVEREGAK
jgi:hypothetical protein